MIKTIDEGIVVFHNTHDAIKADNICDTEKINAGLVPVHPSISLGCGFMLKIPKTVKNCRMSAVKQME